ncbi:DUF2155 domain-containing protein [Sphingomonas elodea]|uniref:DUF2155 domain-containing protein n=1 Tax=Sphingomonas elodea TaxID=179878 RepID=UPI000263212B|nr:DUF2155 domain-containing protein [Sphingomonas elodea]
MRVAAALAALALAGCSGGGSGKGAAAGDNAGDELVITGSGDNQGVDTVSVGPDAATVDAAATPMRERIAVLGVLNKRNGVEREITLKPGQAARIDGQVTVRLRACERTAPWEQDRLTGAFVQMDVRREDQRWHRVFSGWLYKEQPALNVVQHPIYDVWPKSCAMTFRDTGPDTVPASAPGAAGGRRSTDPTGNETAPAEPETAPPPANAT